MEWGSEGPHAGIDAAAEGTHEPQRLSAANAQTAAWTITRAFLPKRWAEWSLTAPATREQTLYGLVHGDIRDRFLEHGDCWTIGSGACVTLWIPPAGHPGAEAFEARRDESQYEIYGARGETMRAADQLIAALKPDVPHWYLDTIATDPDLQGRGLAGRLLDHNLEIRDAAGEACALDTHSPENVAFYNRRGFEVTGRTMLPGDGPDLYMMLREGTTTR